MMLPSATHLVLIPSYNAGPRLLETVRGALTDLGVKDNHIGLGFPVIRGSHALVIKFAAIKRAGIIRKFNIVERNRIIPPNGL